MNNIETQFNHASFEKESLMTIVDRSKNENENLSFWINEVERLEKLLKIDR